jgi:hypothetical protein
MAIVEPLVNTYSNAKPEGVRGSLLAVGVGGRGWPARSQPARQRHALGAANKNRHPGGAMAMECANLCRASGVFRWLRRQKSPKTESLPFEPTYTLPVITVGTVHFIVPKDELR